MWTAESLSTRALNGFATRKSIGGTVSFSFWPFPIGPENFTANFAAMSAECAPNRIFHSSYVTENTRAQW